MKNELLNGYSLFPHTYEDIEIWYGRQLKKENEDADAFTYSELSADGRAYSFYGQKVFEFYPGDNGTAKMKLPGRIIKRLNYEKAIRRDDAFYTLPEKDVSPEMLEALALILRDEKKKIFRNTITEEFGCCHAFKKCSEKGECLYPDDRFFNGCEYRKNLEAGRNFYRDDTKEG